MNMKTYCRYRNAGVALVMMCVLINHVFSQTAYVRCNRYWGGVFANGQNTAITYSAADLNTFADYGAVGIRLNGGESNFSAYITLACKNWVDPS
ncbi:MAG: hypothetical protein N3A63_10185, partial [Bacteroidetes bacterium]|nr:hypothetical protein [Bacteroidota bacterium]